MKKTGKGGAETTKGVKGVPLNGGFRQKEKKNGPAGVEGRSY